MTEQLSAAAKDSLRELLRADLATSAGRRRSARIQKSGPPQGGPIHYPPDALNPAGRRVQRQLLHSPASFISLLNVVGACRMHTLYFAILDETKGRCFDPELLLGVAQRMRKALRKRARSGHPAWVTVEVGEGPHPLHLHIMSRDDAPLPAILTIENLEGEVIAIFSREAGRSKLGTPRKLAEYLRKVGHVGAKDFDQQLPADDPRQPPGFRAALRDWQIGRARRIALGLKRMPRRTFGLFIPRLTDAQRIAALKVLENMTVETQPVMSISQAEWEAQEVQILIKKKWKTRRALERERQSVITLVRAAQDQRNVYKAWQARKDHVSKSTVYNTLERLGWPTIEKVLKAVRRLRSGIRESRLYRALAKSKKK